MREILFLQRGIVIYQLPGWANAVVFRLHPRNKKCRKKEKGRL
jgi:hypothetical protein